MKTNFLSRFVVLGLLFFSSILNAQVTSLDYLLEYDTETCLYNCCIVIGSGSATSPVERAQFNAQYTIVVATGANLSIDALFMPLENNQNYTGSVATTWQISNSVIAPQVQPENDFYSIIPSLAPTSFYNNLSPGDTIRLFGISVSGDDACGTTLRPFMNGVDPGVGEMPGGGDYNNGFTIGGIEQLYAGNRETVVPPGPTITALNACGDIIDIEFDLGNCRNLTGASWIGPSSYTSNEVYPTVDPSTPLANGIYSVTLTDDIGCTSTASVDYCHGINAGEDLVISYYGTDPVFTDLMVCGTGIWSVISSTTTIPFIAGIDDAGAMVEIDPPINGIYTFTWDGGNGCSDELVIEIVDLEPTFLGSDNICIGDQTAMSPSSGFSWVSSNSAIASIDNNGIVTAHAKGSVTFAFEDTITGYISSQSSPLTVNECIFYETNCDLVSGTDLFCELSELNGQTGSMYQDNSPGLQPFPLCPAGGAAHNILWFGFIAQEGDYEITIEFSNWVPGEQGMLGAQVGVYTDCSFVESVYCNPDCVTDPVVIPSNLFFPGNAYYLFIDGCSDSYADFAINVTGEHETTYCYDECSGFIVDITNQDALVTGRAFSDENENGIYDEGEWLLRNTLIDINPGDMTYLTDENGQYSFRVPEGFYDLSATLNEGDWEELVLLKEDVFVQNPCTPGIDFGFIPIPFTGVSLSINNNIIRCDQDVSFYLTVENFGTENFSGTVVFEFDPLTTFVVCNAPDFEVIGNTLSINVFGLEPFDPITFLVVLHMPPISFPIPILEFCGTLYNLDLEDEYHYCYATELRCSYDPNDKRTHPDRTGEVNQTLFDEEIEYTIRFQNNGNDTAFVVRIVDPLDPNIDPSSIRVVAASHEVETCIINDTLIFLFEDINLVDSTTNFEASQGFVTFKCNAYGDRDELTQIFNQADIIFDSNPPIVTNEVLNTMVSELCSEVVNERNETICFGESFEGYTETGIYADTIPLPTGCDSISVLNLEVEQIGFGMHEEEACSGETITYNGTVYDTHGTYQDTSYSMQGCISAIVELTINFSEEITETVDTVLCLGDEYNGHSDSGTYMDTYMAAGGCDSIVTSNIEVVSPQMGDLFIDACPGEVEYGGVIYTEDITFIDTIYDINGCPEEFRTVHIGFFPNMDISEDSTICEGQSYLGFSDTGIYSIDTFSNMTGCDITLTLDLEVLPASHPDCIVGTNDIEQYDLKLFPNPTSSILHVEANEAIENVILYNTSFQSMKIAGNHTGNQISSIDVSSLSSGLYFVALTIEGNTIYRKVFVE